MIWVMHEQTVYTQTLQNVYCWLLIQHYVDTPAGSQMDQILGRVFMSFQVIEYIW